MAILSWSIDSLEESNLFKITALSAFLGFCIFLPSCQLNVGQEINDPKVGEIIYHEAPDGTKTLEAKNTSGQPLNGQFLDGDKNPIPAPFSLPNGSSTTMPIPNGAEYIQIGEVDGFTGSSLSLQKTFTFYKIPKTNRADYLPQSGINQGEVLFANIKVDSALGNGLGLSLSAFRIVESALPLPSGTAITTYVRITGDRSFQSGGPLSPFPVEMVVADDGQIGNFEILLNGVLMANQNSTGVVRQSGPWGSTSQVRTWVTPSYSWLQGADIQVQYDVTGEAQPQLITLELRPY